MRASVCYAQIDLPLDNWRPLSPSLLTEDQTLHECSRSPFEVHGARQINTDRGRHHAKHKPGEGDGGAGGAAALDSRSQLRVVVRTAAWEEY